MIKLQYCAYPWKWHFLEAKEGVTIRVIVTYMGGYQESAPDRAGPGPS